MSTPRSFVGLTLFFLAVWNSLGPISSAAESTGGGAARELAFRVPSVHGESLVLERSDNRQWTVVCFVGVECPLVRLYVSRLKQLAEEFSPHAVRFWAVDSNQQDTAEELLAFADEFSWKLPLIKDASNQIADQFGATRTPEVFVLDQNLKIRYRGRIDDQYEPGMARPEPREQHLRQALQALVEDRPVAITSTKPTGCLIGRVKQPVSNGSVTYSNQIASLFQRHCVECHRPGEIGPFSLTDYHEAVGWAETLVEVVDQGRMPPWHATESGLELANARKMSEEEKALLKKWVQDGAPLGDPDKVPPTPVFSHQWQLPTPPELVLAMRDKPFTVPAQGVIDYQYFVIDPGFKEDKWITGAEIVPGNRAVVHHAILFLRPPDGADFRGFGGIGGYVPGQRFTPLPEGYARRIPAGSKFVFQMHYTPIGSEQQDLTRVGLAFIDEAKVTHEVVDLAALDQQFEIPPQIENFEVTARVARLPEDGMLLAITPHMHVRGKAIRIFDPVTSGRRLLLDVPHYDFNWQHTYVLKEPVPLRDLAGLEMVATFDNSANNPFNPDPTQYVTWGDQTWEEMALTFFEVARPRQPSGTVSGGFAKADTGSTESKGEVETFVRDFFQRFDANQDGRIERHETPISFKAFAFDKLDTNDDRALTVEEIEVEYRRRQSRH
jgi:mono/diheme cytochrome c family protein